MSIMASDITAAIHTGHCSMVFLRGTPDLQRRQWCLKKWDDSIDWHLIREHQNDESRIDPAIADSALQAVQMRIIAGVADLILTGANQ